MTQKKGEVYLYESDKSDTDYKPEVSPLRVPVSIVRYGKQGGVFFFMNNRFLHPLSGLRLKELRYSWKG